MVERTPGEHGPGLADVLASAAASLGLGGASDRLGLGEQRHVVVLLVDGLGARLLAAHAADAPFLAPRVAHQTIPTVFPSTTVSALASLGTGLLPGAHGMVGSTFLLPETGQVLAPLQWGDDPHPLAVLPQTTVFERAARAGISVAAVGPSAYERSGLTRSALRGAAYRSADDVAARIRMVREACSVGERSLTYAYWPELDRIGHGSGVRSEAWRSALRRADDLARSIAEAMPPESLLVVTADHGMVDVTERIAIEGDPALRAGIAVIAGEPRVRHVYVEGGPAAAQAVHMRWRERLAGKATVLSREEVADRGLLGPLDGDLADRVGDLVAIAHGEVVLASVTDPTVSGLVGQHGALSEEEMLVPAIVVRA